MVQTKHTKSNPTTFKSKINRNFHKSKWIREIFSINNKKARRPLGDRTGYHTYEMHFVFYVVKFRQHRRANRMMNGTHDRAFTIPSCAYNSLNPSSWVMLFECGENRIRTCSIWFTYLLLHNVFSLWHLSTRLFSVPFTVIRLCQLCSLSVSIGFVLVLRTSSLRLPIPPSLHILNLSIR